MHAETSREDTPVSKVLILETGTGPTDEIKAFCDAHNLVGLKVHKDSLGAVSRTNVDLGGALYSGAQHTQRFIFNLNWSPEMFSEISQDVDTLIDSGELDLF